MNSKVIDFFRLYSFTRRDNLFKAKKTFKVIIMVGSAGHH